MRVAPLPTFALIALLAACGESARVEEANVAGETIEEDTATTGTPATNGATAPRVQRASPTPGASAGVPPPDAGATTGVEDRSAGSPAVPPEAAAGVTSQYACESGHRVEIVRGEVARVTLADGRVIHLRRSEQTPQRYRGEALSFEVRADGATLGQDEVGGFDCRVVE